MRRTMVSTQNMTALINEAKQRMANLNVRKTWGELCDEKAARQQEASTGPTTDEATEQPPVRLS